MGDKSYKTQRNIIITVLATGYDCHVHKSYESKHLHVCNRTTCYHDVSRKLQRDELVDTARPRRVCSTGKPLQVARFTMTWR